jgi:4-hydroxybenzoate polyprenyltransferase
MCFFGAGTAFLAILLVASILLYDAVHKVFMFSPVLMALCRFFLFLAASSAGEEGVTGLAIWTALALACYIVGLSYVAKSESTRGALRYWPCYLLVAPVFLAYLVNQGDYRLRGAILSIVLLIWLVRSLWFAFWSPEKNIGRTVSGLLAGIVLVDLLALAGGNPLIFLLMLALFGGALLFQRSIPAT